MPKSLARRPFSLPSARRRRRPEPKLRPPPQPAKAPATSNSKNRRRTGAIERCSSLFLRESLSDFEINVDKLRKMAGSFRTGGKGFMRRKKKVVHKTTTDNKKLQSTLKKIGVNAIPAIEEVNIFKEDVVIQFTNPKGKPKMSGKLKKKRRLLGEESSQDDLLEKKGNVADDEVDQMSSGDEDYSKGMKKWVIQYHQSRPGIKVLQERIDDFITAHDAQEEQARIEREAKAAEGGWTVVVQHKGRKKTTEAESGIAVGSVAQAAVLDKMAKKKSKDVGLDFYRFQRREAHRNEIMMLQSKFEQDKKRIQEMRAARKFRPY